MEHYAVGYKGWVEVRKASAPPRHKLSALTVPHKRVREVFDPNMYNGYGGYRIQVDDTKKRIAVSVYTGGQVVATVPTTLVRSRIGVTIPQGTMIQLMPDQVDVLLRDMGNAIHI